MIQFENKEGGFSNPAETVQQFEREFLEPAKSAVDTPAPPPTATAEGAALPTGGFWRVKEEQPQAEPKPVFDTAKEILQEKGRRPRCYAA